VTSLTTCIRRCAVVLGIILLLTPAYAWIDIKVEHDKTFDFQSVKTWAWDPKDYGGVRMARTAMDDPEAMRKKAEPIIFDAVATEMKSRGLQLAPGAQQITLTYYLLLTSNLSGQTMGQFLPATTAWGLPPFPPATQSLKMMNHGSLVLDFVANGKVVWRGVAQADIKIDADDKKRESVMRAAIHELLKRFPPRP
jgi:hypothetical protein